MNSIRAQNAILELLRSSLTEENETDSIKGGADAMDALKDAFLAGGDAAEADDQIPSEDDHLIEEEVDGDGEVLSSNASSQNDNESQNAEEEIKEALEPVANAEDADARVTPTTGEPIAYDKLKAHEERSDAKLNGGNDNLEFEDDEPHMHGGYVDSKRLIVITASTKFPFVMKQKQKKN